MKIREEYRAQVEAEFEAEGIGATPSLSREENVEAHIDLYMALDDLDRYDPAEVRAVTTSPVSMMVIAGRRRQRGGRG